MSLPTKPTKQYGLLHPKQAERNAIKSLTQSRARAFKDDSSEEEGTDDWVKTALQKDTSKPKKQTKLDIEKVLKDDPTAYQYDEIYDEMTQKKQEKLSEDKKERKPKYITALMMEAERRKTENERRLERKVQKERAAEGDEFADKDAFITSSYKKKLEEMRKLDEKEKRMDMLEAIGDVTKQKDMTGFYRHILRTVDDNNGGEKKELKSRQYRKRKHSPDDKEGSGDQTAECTESEDGEIQTSEGKNKKAEDNIVVVIVAGKGGKEEKHIKKEGTKAAKDEKYGDKEAKKGKDENASEDKQKVKENEKIIQSKDEKEMTTKIKSKLHEMKNEEIEKGAVKEPKISVWEKRTVGEVFETALQNFYKRKAARETANSWWL